MVQLRNRRGDGDEGVALVLVALLMVALLGVAAIVIDLGNARQVRRQEQGGVDAAAVAAAQDLPVKANNASTRLTKQTQARNTAMTYATRNLVGTSTTAPTCTTATTCTGTVGKVTLTVATPWNPTASAVPSAADPTYDNYLGFVYVKACQSTPTFFSGVLNQSSPIVCRSAVGRFRRAGGGYDFGLVATDPSKCGALTFAGNSETQLTSNGAVMVNSNCASGSTQALDSSGSSWQLRFVDTNSNEVPGFIGVVGGATLNPCDPATQTTSCTQTVPTTGISPFGDPLSGLVAPSKPTGVVKSCPQNGGGALTPGAFNDCKVTNGDVTMTPGIYWFEGGFEMNGGHLKCVDDPAASKTCAGNGILLFVKTGGLKLNGNGQVYLPPYRMSCTEYYTDTCYDGLSVWQVSTDEASINGTNDFSIGSVYVPNANLKTNGTGGGAKVNVTGVVVAKTVEISGTFDFNIVVPDTSPDPDIDSDLGLEK